MAWFAKHKDEGATPPTPAPVLSCSFCHKTQLQVKKLIAGPEVWICDECVKLCADIIAEAVPPVPVVAVPTPPPPMAELQAAFDARCAGLEPQKRALLAALRLHIARLQQGAPSLRPPVILLVGPHGSGKSHLLRTLMGLTTLPAHHADINRLSATGYVGLDVENLLWELVRQADQDYRVGESGVLALDGLHRIEAKSPPLGSARDVSGEAVQRDLLRVVEGMKTEVQAFGTRHPQRGAEPFWCDRLLVVLGATFAGLPEGDRAQRAFLAERGMLLELLARVDMIVPVPAPDEAQLRAVLTHPEAGLLPQRLAALTALGHEVTVEDDAIDAMVATAAASPDGAWALHRPLARMVAAASDPAHTGPLVVTAALVRGWVEP